MGRSPHHMCTCAHDISYSCTWLHAGQQCRNCWLSEVHTHNNWMSSCMPHKHPSSLKLTIHFSCILTQPLPSTAHYVHRSQSFWGAVRVHGFCDVPADVHLQHLLHWIGKIHVWQKVVSSVIHCLSPLVATFTADKRRERKGAFYSLPGRPTYATTIDTIATTLWLSLYTRIVLL